MYIYICTYTYFAFSYAVFECVAYYFPKHFPFVIEFRVLLRDRK